MRYTRILTTAFLALSLAACGTTTDVEGETSAGGEETGSDVNVTPGPNECQSAADCTASKGALGECAVWSCEATEEGHNVCVEGHAGVNTVCSEGCEADASACEQCACDGAGACGVRAAFDYSLCGGTDGCTGDFCVDGECIDDMSVVDCNDGDPGTDDLCEQGICSHANNTADCDDGDSCTENDVCADGA